MRHKVTLLVCILAVAFGLFLAVNEHRNYIHQLTLKNAQAAAQHARDAIRVQVQAQSTAKKLLVANTDIVLLVAQCKEGQAAYDLLTPAQKQHAKAPYCAYSAVQ